MPVMRRSAAMAAAIALAAAALAVGVPASAQEAALLARAERLLAEAPLIDGHNDLPTALLRKVGDDVEQVDLAAVQTAYPADIPRLRRGKVGAQFWSAYVDSRYIAEGGALKRRSG